MAAEERRSLDDALIGRTVAGKFTIESRIGGGGMGSVYRARQAGLDKIVAIKVLHRELLAEPTFASRFKREATSASRIDHPSSLRVIDFGEEPDGLLYIAMEHLEGKTLFKILREEAPLAPGRIVDLSRQILAALAAAHDLGIVHRDLKPENVIVLPGKDDDGGASEHVKVCDFGIAKLQTEGDVDEKLTMEGSIVGTPEYLSPEQARGGQLDARSDLYSMGVILFEMLTGQPPFRGDTPLAIVLKHLDAVPPKPSSLASNVDPKLEAVCLKALEKAPGDRFASAREMRASLVTDSPHGVAPAVQSRPSNILVMTQTPPPVSSTPVPLLSRRSSALSAIGTGPRSRFSEIAEPAPSGNSRALAAVVAIALLGGGGGAYLIRRHAPSTHATATAHEAPLALPSSTAAPAQPTDPGATLSAGLASSMAASPGDFPPSELPGTAGSAAPAGTGRPGRKHRKGAPAGSAGSPGGASKTAVTTNPANAANPGSPAAPGNPGDPGLETEFDDEPAGATPPGTPGTAAATTPPVTTPSTAAHVSYVVHTTGLEESAVKSGLPTGRFASCYHGAAGSHASITVHIEFGKGEPVTRSDIRDPSSVGLGACLAEAAKHASVAGTGSADVQVDLSAP